MLQDNEKMKVQDLRSLLFDLFETLQAVRTWQKEFRFISNFVAMATRIKNYCLLLKSKRCIV